MTTLVTPPDLLGQPAQVEETPIVLQHRLTGMDRAFRILLAASGAIVLIMFVAVVVAANQLDFASSVFLAAFIILVGGAVLSVSLAAGIAASGRFRRYFEERSERAVDHEERSLWSHL